MRAKPSAESGRGRVGCRLGYFARPPSNVNLLTSPSEAQAQPRRMRRRGELIRHKAAPNRRADGVLHGDATQKKKIERKNKKK
ncbi:unnamed protein product, partial [Iphiclides podalirius]